MSYREDVVTQQCGLKLYTNIAISANIHVIVHDNSQVLTGDIFGLLAAFFPNSNIPVIRVEVGTRPPSNCNNPIIIIINN